MKSKLWVMQRSTDIDEFGTQGELHNAVSGNLKRSFCSERSDLGMRMLMARNFSATSSVFVITKEAWHGDGASISELLVQPHSAIEDQEQSAKVLGSATATTTLQQQTPMAKSRKQEMKNMQASGPSSPSPGVVNSMESSNEAGRCSSPLSIVYQTIQYVMNALIKLVENIADVLKCPTHPLTLSEVLMAASSSENKTTLDRNTASSMLQPQAPNAKSRKQEWKNMQAAGPSSLSPCVLNSIVLQ